MKILLGSVLVFAAAVTARASAVSPEERPMVIRSARHGCHEIALTFDVCPVRRGSGFDTGLVDELVEQKIPATFFVSGRWMIGHEAAVRRLRHVPFFELGTHRPTRAHLTGL